MLAKTKIFHASYIRRAEMYGDKIAENTTGELSTVSLYADAVKLCDDIISGVYGSYELEDYYPAVFTKRNKEIMFSVLAEEGLEPVIRYRWDLQEKPSMERPMAYT